MARHRSRAQLVARGHGAPARAAVDDAPCARPTPSTRLSGMAEEWHSMRPRSLRKVSKTCAAPSAKALLHRADVQWASVVLIWTYDPVADSVASSGLARCIAPPHPVRLPEDPRRANIDITSERPCYRPPSSRTGPERIAQHPVTVRPRGMGRVALRLWLMRAALRGWQAGPTSSRVGRSLLGAGHRLLYSREVGTAPVIPGRGAVTPT